MANDYLPRKEAKRVTWMQSFSKGISDNPSRYGLMPAQAQSIAEVVRKYVAAVRVATNQGTRTRPTLIVRDDAYSIAETLCRQYYSIIKCNLGVSDDDKIAIGVRPINPSRRRIECPQTSPLLKLRSSTPGRHYLSYNDTNTPESPAKPFGAMHLQLFVGITDDAQASLEEAKFYGTYTRNQMVAAFTDADDGRLATYYARWASRRNQFGPWSLPVSMRIAA